MKTITLSLFFTLFGCQLLYGIPPTTTTKYIKIDQFGYLPGSKKVAVIVDPKTGYDRQ